MNQNYNDTENNGTKKYMLTKFCADYPYADVQNPIRPPGRSRIPHHQQVMWKWGTRPSFIAGQGSPTTHKVVSLQK